MDGVRFTSITFPPSSSSSYIDLPYRGPGSQRPFPNPNTTKTRISDELSRSSIPLVTITSIGIRHGFLIPCIPRPDQSRDPHRYRKALTGLCILVLFAPAIVASPALDSRAIDVCRRVGGPHRRVGNFTWRFGAQRTDTTIATVSRQETFIHSWRTSR